MKTKELWAALHIENTKLTKKLARHGDYTVLNIPSEFTRILSVLLSFLLVSAHLKDHLFKIDTSLIVIDDTTSKVFASSRFLDALTVSAVTPGRVGEMVSEMGNGSSSMTA